MEKRYLVLSFLVWFLSLFQSHNANSHAVRFRVCQLINKLLGSMSENALIDDDLFDRIHETMLIRVTDKFPNIRIQAALAMARLQEPQNPDCPTMKGTKPKHLDRFEFRGGTVRIQLPPVYFLQFYQQLWLWYFTVCFCPK